MSSRTVRLSPIYIVAALAVIAISILVFNPGLLPTKKNFPGCFEFADNTTQGWTLDQLYETAPKPIKKVVTASPAPPYNNYEPFTLVAGANGTLQAESPLFLVPEKTIKTTDFFFVSPDLSTDLDWQNIRGVSAEITRNFSSKIGDPNASIYHAQLQVTIKLNADGSEKLITDFDSNGKAVFQKLSQLGKKEKLTVQWGDTLQIGGSAVPKSDFTLKQIKIRITLPGYIPNGEHAHAGTFDVDNVCHIQ